VKPLQEPWSKPLEPKLLQSMQTAHFRKTSESGPTSFGKRSQALRKLVNRAYRQM